MKSTDRRPRVGILGGTFDPVHEGHIAIAAAVRDELALDEVVFVPAGNPYLRVSPPVASPASRAAMVAVAIRGEPSFRLSRVDIERPGPSYAVDTIADLRKELGSEAELFYIVGGDTLRRLSEWRNPEGVASEATIVSVDRPGESPPEALPPGHPGAAAVHVSGPMVDVSAADIRARLREGRGTHGRLPEAVARFIEENDLYRGDGA